MTRIKIFHWTYSYHAYPPLLRERDLLWGVSCTFHKPSPTGVIPSPISLRRARNTEWMNACCFLALWMGVQRRTMLPILHPSLAFPHWLLQKPILMGEVMRKRQAGWNMKSQNTERGKDLCPASSSYLDAASHVHKSPSCWVTTEFYRNLLFVKDSHPHPTLCWKLPPRETTL